MKNILLLAITIFAMSTLTYAQSGTSKKVTKEELKTKKIAFLSTELKLSTDEAKIFWPAYNNYDAKMHGIHKESRVLKKKMKNFEKLTIEEAYQTTENVIKLESKKTSLRKEYLKIFSDILGKKKGAKVFYAEIKFKRELLRKIKNGSVSPP